MGICPEACETVKPEGMTDEDWNGICDLPLTIRPNSIILWESMKKRASEPQVTTCPPVETPLPTLQDILPLCPDSQRAIPNVFLRSAIFSVAKAKESLRQKLVPAQGGYEVRITASESLNQSDLDVWLQAVHMAKNSPLGTVCEIKAHSFLNGIGRSKGGKDYDLLKTSLIRLQNTLIEFKAGAKWIRFNLISL